MLFRSASLLHAAHQPEAAAAITALPAARGTGPADVVESLDLLTADAGDVGAGAAGAGLRFAAPAAALLARVRPGLVDDTGPDPSVSLFAGFPSGWLGQAVEVHEAPSRFGPISCAVRWHGARPALLWDLQSPEGRSLPAGLTLHAPALDPSWSTTVPRGEALLAQPAPPPNLAGSFS